MHYRHFRKPPVKSATKMLPPWQDIIAVFGEAVEGGFPLLKIS
jgi:hypothetical protein